jgi:hypothetical protein
MSREGALKRLISLCVALISLAVVPASAHHSLSVYNRLSAETIEGTVQKFNWSNPHVQLVIMASSPDGAIAQWNFESGSINRLASAGINRNIVAVGDKITVTYNPRRDGAKSGFLVTIVSARGRKYDMRRNRGPTRGGAEEG